jgi:hypothetical protein
MVLVGDKLRPAHHATPRMPTFGRWFALCSLCVLLVIIAVLRRAFFIRLHARTFLYKVAHAICQDLFQNYFAKRLDYYESL